jgi:hypothetical protein
MRVPNLVVSLAGLVLLAGCADGSGGEGDGAAAPSASPTSSESADPAPESTPSPAVALADGLTAEVEAARITGPKGWTDEANKPGDTTVVLKAPYDAVSAVSLSEIADDLGVLENNVRERGLSSLSETYPQVTLRKPVVLDGVKFYRTAGPHNDYFWLENYGAVHNNYMIRVNIQLALRTPPAKRRKIIDSVLPTFEWK